MLHKTIKTHEEIKKISGPVQNANDIHKQKLSKGDRIALWMVGVVGTFGFFMFTVALTMTPVAWPASMTVIMFISSSFLQLTLLPLIMIGQNIQSAQSEARAQADYEINKKAELEVEAILHHLENQNEMMLKILERLESQGK